MHAVLRNAIRYVMPATNRNLALELQAGRFREDLFYRIAVLAINTPSLRKRVSDTPLLVEHFLLSTNNCLRRREITVKQRDCYASTAPHCTSGSNAHGDLQLAMRPRTRIGFGWGFVLGGGCIDLRIDRIAPYSRVKRARHR